eukprot:8697105-Pyramimonas_sp.AAC.1
MGSGLADFEFTIGPPTVIMKKDEETGKDLEPYEVATVEVGEAYTGAVVDLLASRKGQMLDMNMCDSAGQMLDMNMCDAAVSRPS